MATDPACLQALAQLSALLDRRGIISALIGGMALQLLQPLATARVTHDIDLALLVESFDEYEEIRSELLAIGWTAEPEEHRLRTREGCLVDLLPYPRKDVVDDHVILPRSKTPLNVAGMVEAIVASKPVLLGGTNHIRVRVAPIEHIALLKMVAWAERGATASLLSPTAEKAALKCFALLADAYGPAISRIWVEWARDREDENRFRDEVGQIAAGLRAGLGEIRP